MMTVSGLSGGRSGSSRVSLGSALDIDDTFLDEVGLAGLPGHRRELMRKFIRESLGIVLGTGILRSLSLTTEALADLELVARRQGVRAALQTLDRESAPDQLDKLRDDLARFKERLRNQAPYLLAIIGEQPDTPGLSHQGVRRDGCLGRLGATGCGCSTSGAVASVRP